MTTHKGITIKDDHRGITHKTCWRLITAHITDIDSITVLQYSSIAKAKHGIEVALANGAQEANGKLIMTHACLIVTQDISMQVNLNTTLASAQRYLDERKAGA
jgi:hypothetical protein